MNGFCFGCEAVLEKAIFEIVCSFEKQKKCNNKFDVLIFEMLFVRKKTSSHNVQNVYIKAKLYRKIPFVIIFFCKFN